MRSSQPFVTVIIPCYNAAEFLDETLQSVTAQTHQAWRCIVMDDESSDDSLEIARRWETKHPNIRVLTGPNKGRAAVINEALTLLDTDTVYLAFLDADDVLHPEFLARTVNHMETNPQVGITSVGFYSFQQDVSKSREAFCRRMVPGLFLPRPLKENETRTPFITFFCGTGSGPFSILRRSVFEETTGLESAMTQRPVHGHEDTDIFCQMSLISELHSLPQRLYYKREHADAATQNHQGMQDSYTIFRKKWDRIAQTENPFPEEFRLARDYYQNVHCPMRNLKVAMKAIRIAIKKRDKGTRSFAFTLIRENLPKLFIGYPWFLTRFHHRRARLKHPALLGYDRRKSA